MAPLASVDTDVDNRICGYEEKVIGDELCQELEKGIRSMRKGEVYSIEEAWEEIDGI